MPQAFTVSVTTSVRGRRDGARGRCEVTIVPIVTMHLVNSPEARLAATQSLR